MAVSQTSMMDFVNVGIGTALKRNRLKVPLNQREYSWEDQHVLALFHDLADAIDNKKPAYFLGTIVLTQSDDDALEIADGQQRLATITILLAAMRDYFFEQSDDLMVRALDEFLYTIVRGRREIEPRLGLNVTDNDYFRKRILELPDAESRTQASPQCLSHQRIERAATLAQQHIQDIIKPFSDNRKTERLNTWIDFLEGSAQIILVTVPDDMNAFVMFETLNDRGLRTSQSDLVKNFLFAESDDRIDEAQQKWASMSGTLEVLDDDEITIIFLRHYLISQSGHMREREVLQKVKDKVGGRAEAIEFLSSLSMASTNYVALLNPAHPVWAEYNASIREHIRMLGTLKVTPFRPLMLAVSLNFPKAEAEKAFRQFVFWSVRFLIVGGARSGRVEEALNLSAFKVTKGQIARAQDLLTALSPVLPTDAEFEQSFSEATVSSHALARYYLRSLEKKEQNDPEPEFVPNEETIITLEHILPENPGANWPAIDSAVASAVYKRIGNLVLLPVSENGDLGNKSFADKKPAFKDSGYLLTKEVEKAATWGVAEIKSRQERLAKLALKTWPLKSP